MCIYVGPVPPNTVAQMGCMCSALADLASSPKCIYQFTPNSKQESSCFTFLPILGNISLLNFHYPSGC